MKRNTSLLLSFGLLVLACSLYRVWEGRPFGFAPQIAIALFSGAIIREKKWSFLMPLASMLLSDAFYELLYVNGYSTMQGFYKGQALNYVLFVSMTVFGFFIRNNNIKRMTGAALAAPTAYFALSNFGVWLGSGGYGHPKTFAGLVQCFVDGLPFYGWSLAATTLFSALFFGSWYLMNRKQEQVAF